ncbi:TetR/AcrR family transcriptional regulator [Dactylosporangium sp. CA-092794]|uniref:TetR/AcrR family transcriptional regulator n=1 Tax=Dactylosporangium sp. CA-092794 TaxID=3239929 RepID=UPI003D932379
MTTRKPRATRPVEQPRRSDLLDAAERVFHRRSYAGASMQEIADEFGVLKGSLYHYVRSKEELLLEVEERAHHKILGRMQSTIGQTDDEIGRIWLYIYTMVHTLAEEPAIGGLAKAALELPPGKGRRRILRERKKFEDLLLGLLEDAQAAGRLSKTLNLQITAYGILGMAQSTDLWYKPEGSVPPHEIARILTDLLVSGLVSDGAFDSSALANPIADQRTAPD